MVVVVVVVVVGSGSNRGRVSVPYVVVAWLILGLVRLVTIFHMESSGSSKDSLSRLSAAVMGRGFVSFAVLVAAGLGSATGHNTEDGSENTSGNIFSRLAPGL